MKTQRKTLMIEEGNNSPFAEAYRTLNTNIKFSNLDQPIKTILITSSGAIEGKSTTVANLGIVMAQTGNKVLLVDTDLRKPILHSLFDLDNSDGLSKGIINAYNTDLEKGDLAGFGAGDIFKLISVQQKTGILEARDADSCIHVYFDDGKIVDANWIVGSRGKGLGERLLRRGKITEENLKDCMLSQQQTSQPLAFVLVNSGAIDINDLKGTLMLQIEETLRHLFGLNDSSFSFHSTNTMSSHSELGDFTSSIQPFSNWTGHTSKYPFISGRLNSFIQDTEIENLRVVTSGPQPPNPFSLLNSNAMKEFLNDVKFKFDIILLDSPPILAASDASVLATMVDGVVLVVRSGQLARSIIQQSKEQLEGVNARILGTILNDVDIKRDSYYYFHYYYHYYSRYSQYYYKKENPPIVPDIKQ